MIITGKGAAALVWARTWSYSPAMRGTYQNEHGDTAAWMVEAAADA